MPDFDKLAFPGASLVQVVETAVRDCTVESVVVYGDRAEVKRRVPVSLSAGKNEVVVHGLSTCIDKDSIRVEGKGKAVITDVIYSSKTTEEVQNPGSKEEYDSMKEEIKSHEYDLKRLLMKEKVLKDEKKLLNRFADHISGVHSVKGDNDRGLCQLVDKNNVTAVMEFFDKHVAKVANLDSRLSNIAEDINLIKEEVSVLRKNADKLDPGKAVKTNNIVK